MASTTHITGCWLLLAFTLLFFVMELVISILCDSLMTMVDCCNTLYVCFSLALPVVRALVTYRPSPSSYSFGWRRLGPLLSLISSVLLTSLCFSVTLNIIARFLRPHPIQRPILAMVVGLLGILINLTVRLSGEGREDRPFGDIKAHNSFTKLNTCESPPDSKESYSGTNTGSSQLPADETCDQAAKGNCVDKEETHPVGMAEKTMQMQRPETEKITKGTHPATELEWNACLETEGGTLEERTGCQNADKSWKPSANDETDSQVNYHANTAECMQPDVISVASKFEDNLILYNPLTPNSFTEPQDSKEPSSTCKQEAPASIVSSNFMLEKNGSITAQDLEQQPLGVCSKTAIKHKWSKLFLLNSFSIFKSVLSSCFVLVSGVFSYFLGHNCLHTKTYHFCLYLDPLLSAVMVAILVATAIPFMKRSGLIVLQGIPCHIDIQRLRGRLTILPGIVDVHELHVWQLSSQCTVATAHIKCGDPTSYGHLANMIKMIFHSEGIYSTTIQPEFIQHTGEGQRLDLCELACGKECAKKLCCVWRDA